MTHKITSECVCCGACSSECPLKCIKEDEVLFTIDSKVCSDCGICAAICPMEAIIMEDENGVPEKNE